MQFTFPSAGMPWLFLGLIALASTGCATELQPVEHVELTNLMGTWYEVAYGSSTGSTDEYARTFKFWRSPSGELRVTKTWQWHNASGQEESDTATLEILDRQSNAKFRGNFYLTYGTVSIIDMDRDYRYMMVGTPNRNQLWILSRTTTIPPSVYAALESKAVSLGFNKNCLNRVTW
jgi:apolipoprotein D and lipocalin family protein